MESLQEKHKGERSTQIWAFSFKTNEFFCQIPSPMGPTASPKGLIPDSPMAGLLGTLKPEALPALLVHSYSPPQQRSLPYCTP